MWLRSPYSVRPLQLSSCPTTSPSFRPGIAVRKTHVLKIPLSFLFIIACLTNVRAQLNVKTKTPPAGEASIFRVVTTKSALTQRVGAEISEFAALETDAESYAELVAAATDRWSLSLPPSSETPAGLTLDLEANYGLLATNFKLRRANGEAARHADLGKHYRGQVRGVPGSHVALSVLEGEMTAVISRPGQDRLTLAKVTTKDRSPHATYLLYPDRQVMEAQELNCGTADSGVPYSAKQLYYQVAGKGASGCVGVYFEIDHDVVLDKGGIVPAAQYLTALFNQVTVFYDRIGVTLNITEILAWDQPSPYFGTSSANYLSGFQANRPSFNGDIAQLVSYGASGGIAILNGVCHPYSAARMSFSSIGPTFETVPTYSWSVMVMAHELGHLLGSQHTHACVWNGNSTAIDGCARVTEGNCGLPGLPAGGGTLMSYCHTRNGVGIDFNQGFGPQPGAVIAARVNAARSCLQNACGGGNNGGGGNGNGNGGNPGGGGGNPDTCPDGEEVSFRLTLDNFGMETTWKLSTLSGTVITSGGPYPKKQAGRMIRRTVCLPYDCYVFEVRDADNDGICCEYGNGGFILLNEQGDELLNHDGRFGSSLLHDFCLEDPDDGGGGGGDDSCPHFNFNTYPPISYGTNQDYGQMQVLQGGDVLYMENNAWKAIEYPYVITPQTWVSFWFRSTRRGEVHAIGFDDNLVISSQLTFRVYGTQRWGISDFANYSGSGDWEYYEIPIGQYYTGAARYLFMTADHDVGTRDGNSYFRGVTLSEGGPCNEFAQLPAAPAGEPEAPPTRPDVILRPNPASDVLYVEPLRVWPDGRFRIVDMNGRAVASGQLADGQTEIDVSHLPVGTYVLRCSGADEELSRRFVVSR